MQLKLPEAWQNITFSEVRGYAYNPNGDYGVPIILRDGRLHSTVRNPKGALLSPEQVERLMMALFAPNPTETMANCYNPRHAFVFRDDQQRVVATVGICFECSTYHASPDVQALQLDWSSLRELVDQLWM